MTQPKPNLGLWYAYAKVGTMSLERVVLDREPVLEKTLNFKRLIPGDRWHGARVWKLEGELVFLELW
jgi:hypothetical protein